MEKNIYNHANLTRMKKLGEKKKNKKQKKQKTGVLVELDLPSAGGGTEARV